MAATTRPIVWDFYREEIECEEIGGQIHYYDEWGQNLLITSEGLVTQVCKPAKGLWETTPLDPAVVINKEKYSKLRIDHPSNGTVYGVAIINDELFFIRYVYMEDISNIIESWDVNLTSDNNIQDINLTMSNVSMELIVNNSTLFQPGARILFGISVGNSGIVKMGTYWLDEIDIDMTSESIPISGRNTIGYYLKDQTMDDLTKIQGRLDDTVKALMEHAGVIDYEVQDFKVWVPYEFKPTETVLDALDKVNKSVSNPDPSLSFNVVELPDGKILCGHQRWISDRYPNNVYLFEEGKEVFARTTKKLIDGVYTQIICTGELEKDKPLTPVTVQVKNQKNWFLGKHRTKHLEAPNFMTQNELQLWAETQSKKFQYIGIGEEFISPFRPQLIPKDIAQVKRSNGNVGLGLITEVNHSFSLDEGYVTEFSVDSGGIEVTEDGYKNYSDIATLNGTNRKQTVTDLIKILASK